MRLLSVPWRPRRSFWQCLAYIKRARRWRSAERADACCRSGGLRGASEPTRSCSDGSYAVYHGLQAVLAGFGDSLVPVYASFMRPVEAFEASFVTVEHSRRAVEADE